jgi:hypothetical protein
MKDTEIIKALECCRKAKTMGDCLSLGCPASTLAGCRYVLRTDEDFEGVLYYEMLKDAIDLINRQKAEIERLKAPKYMVMPKPSNKDIWEFSPLVFTEEYTIKRIDEEGIKAEAYKELTKMLKSKCEYSDYYETYIISRNDIDYYAKELTEGKADEDK